MPVALPADFLAALARLNPRFALALPPRPPQAGEIWIGCGEHAQAAAGALVLNHKGAALADGRYCACVSDYAAQADVSVWSPAAKAPLAPAEALRGQTLVIEDASPDSVLACVLLLARLAGLDLAPFAPWRDAARHWEREGWVELPAAAWVTLHSALAHRHFPQGTDVAVTAYERAWRAAFEFTRAGLAAGADPQQIPADAPWAQAARSALAQEEQVYADWLLHARQLQLALPLAGTPDRRLLVDALLLTEDQPTGAAKVFYRNDRARSPLGAGFGFAAQYRPQLRGSGDDITLAVDPRRGVSLRPLWEAIEARECRAWAAAGEPRPDDAPRRLPNIEPRWNQPWYLNPDATLIAAPRALPDGRPGSKLDWAAVLDVLWQQCQPLREIEICTTGSDRPVPILHLRPETPVAASPRRLLRLHWPDPHHARPGRQPRALTRAPVVEQLLAALLARTVTDAAAPAPDTLPAPGSWTRVSLAGGFALVSEAGLCVLDDWNPQPIDMAAVHATFVHAAELDAGIAGLDARIGSLATALQQVLNQARPAATALLRHGRQAAALEVELALLRGRHVEAPSAADARSVRAALDQCWQLDARLGALDTRARALGSALATFADLRTRVVSRFLALYGFAFFMAASLSGTVSKLLATWLAAPAATSPPPLPPAEPGGLLQLGVFAGLSVGLVLLLQGLVIWTGRRDRTD